MRGKRATGKTEGPQEFSLRDPARTLTSFNSLLFSSHTHTHTHTRAREARTKTYTCEGSKQMALTVASVSPRLPAWTSPQSLPNTVTSPDALTMLSTFTSPTMTTSPSCFSTFERTGERRI